MASRFRTILSTLSIIGVSVGVSLIAVEFVVRLVIPQQVPVVEPGLFLPTEGLEYEHAPNLAIQHNVGEGPVHYFTDEKGYRIAAPNSPNDLPNDDSEFKVLALGDSFLEAVAVEYEATMTARLEVAYRECIGSGVRIHNTGVRGWDPNHYLIKARQELPSGDYDAVVTFVFLGNDIIEVPRDSFPARTETKRSWTFPRSYRDLVGNVLQPLYRNVGVKSHLVLMVKSRSNTLLAQLGLTKNGLSKTLVVSEERSEYWTTTADVVEQIDREARANGVPALFVIIPADYQIDQKLGKALIRGANLDATTVDFDQPNRILKREFQERGLRVIDSAPSLRSAFDDGEKVYLSIDRHLSGQGHRVVSEDVLPHLASILDPSNPTAACG